MARALLEAPGASVTHNTADSHMAEKTTEEIEQMWGEIRSAGNRGLYIERKLEQLGLAVDRRDTARMSKRELGEYKKSLKAEAAAKAQMLKETWIAYKSKNIVHLGEGVFWNDDWDWDKYDHPRAEERAAENNIPAIDKPAQLAELLGVDIKHLRWMTYHREVATSLHYERFTIPKRSGGEREIWAPRPMLKSAQRWILREIVERLPMHGAAHGFIPGRSILTNAEQHTNSRILVKLDLKDFFPTVTFPRVKGVFRKAGYREQIATLLALLCTESPREVVRVDDDKIEFVALGPRSLPQGAPTSPAITNTLCLSLDRRLTGLAEKLGWRYTRYADDLTFSLPLGTKEGEPGLGKLLGAVRHIVSDEGFTLHPDKTRIIRTGGSQRVTGLVVNGEGKPRVPRKTRRMLRAALHNVKHGKPLHDGESIYTLLGWSAFIYMTDRELGATFLDELRGVVG